MACHSIQRFFSIASILCFFSIQAHALFVPEEISGPISEIETSGIMVMTEPAEFTEIVKNIESVYKPIVKNFGGNLTINGNWGSNSPNAYARKTFSNWQVVITGGLARHPAMTKDGIALVVCHEMGHHLAGFPFVETGIAHFIGMKWMANEGESDYFATRVCARKIWSKELQQNAAFRSTASAFVKSECDKYWRTEADQNLCYRTVTASESLATVLASLAKTGAPQLHTPTPKVVSSTYSKHPEAQCRLDTYFQGAICPAAWNDSVIPGQGQPGGLNGLQAEKFAAAYSCTKAGRFTYGLRPTCWFKPRL